MKITQIQHHSSSFQTKVMDCMIDTGYQKVAHGSLPDIDCDFDAERRQEVKQHLEDRYNHDGKQRVFSAGTFNTLGLKSVVTDVSRNHRIPVSTVKYMTAIFQMDDVTWTDAMRAAFKSKTLYNFVQKYPHVFEEMMPIMNQPRSGGMHASAIIITPDYVKGADVNCYEVLPVRYMDGQLASEISGYDVDEVGLLKNDVLGIAELSRISQMFELCKQEFGVELDMLDITRNKTDDPDVFRMISRGATQGVFQMSGDGITRFIKHMRPDNINDIIASVALFRPGPLRSGAAMGYIEAKHGIVEPVYLWGTYEILKDTYGYMVYQEQISQTAQKIGSLSLGDGVNLVKALSKKKLEKVRKFKEKYFQGADANGCPRDAAEKIWSAVEDAAKYSFNKSHATAYGLTSYVGAWLKTHYPVVFYTVMLKWQDEDKLPLLLREIRELEGVRIERPNINISQQDFVTDYQSNVIYWSLCRIKQCGLKAGDYIVRERGFFGDYTSLDNFIDRIFKYKYGKSEWFIDGDNPKERNPVTSRIVRQLIISGAFDECEHIGSPEQRYDLMKRAAERLGFQITDKMLDESQIGRFFYWEALQIKESGFGEINFGRIFSEYADGAALKKDYIKFQELDEEFRNFEKGGVICAQIESAEEKSFKDSKTGERKKYGKLTLRQNIDRATVTLWNDAWNSHKENLLHNNGKIIIAVVQVKYSEYEGRHAFQINKSAYVKVI